MRRNVAPQAEEAAKAPVDILSDQSVVGHCLRTVLIDRKRKRAKSTVSIPFFSFQAGTHKCNTLTTAYGRRSREELARCCGTTIARSLV